MSLTASKRCWAEIDLMALERNVGRIRSALPKHIKYISVVKADAYGHGMPHVVPRLMQSFIDVFAVANVGEGASIRELGAGWPILILSPLLPEEDGALLEYNLTATLSSLEEAERFNQLGKKHNTAIPIHLKLDTGMGRSGVWFQEARSLYDKILNTPHLSLKGIYTHFSAADSNPAFTNEQRTHFVKTLNTFPHLDYNNLFIHADNSAALETFDASLSLNAVRVGIIQFGILPNPNAPFLSNIKTEPILSLKSRIGLIKELPAGVSVSYGRTHKLKRPTRIAIVTAGYGDGISLQLSNRGQVIVRGKRTPIIGRITMDQTIIDITDNPEVSLGDTVSIIGREGSEGISISEWSHWANTIPWDTYCSITKRVPRIYLNTT